jgi:predicted nucleic acid-binding protein
MNEVFVDTSGWASALLKDDSHHTNASRLIRQWRREKWNVVTTNYVLSELVALLISFHTPLSTILEYVKTLQSDPLVEIVHINQELDKKAWQMLANRLDKEWSLVDAASFVVMKERGLTEALTADHHFEQSSFVRLLR